MSGRRHFHRTEPYSISDGQLDSEHCGEGIKCSFWWAPIAAAAIGGGLGLLSAREQASAQEAAWERSQGAAEQMAEPQIWGGADQYARDFLLSAKTLYNTGRYAPTPHPLELEGRDLWYDYAKYELPGLVDAALTSWERGLDPGLDPYLPEMIAMAQQDLNQQYERTILPRIQSEAQAVGGFGGSRQGVAEGIASQGLSDALGDVETRLRSSAYRDMLGHQQAAWGVAPQMATLGLMPSQALIDVGAMHAADQLHAARNLMGYANMIAPYTQIQSGGGQVFPAPTGANPYTGALQGIGTGLGLYNMWNQFGGFGGTQQQQAANRFMQPTSLGAAGGGTYGTGVLS